MKKLFLAIIATVLFSCSDEFKSPSEEVRDLEFPYWEYVDTLYTDTRIPLHKLKDLGKGATTCYWEGMSGELNIVYWNGPAGGYFIAQGTPEFGFNHTPITANLAAALCTNIPSQRMLERIERNQQRQEETFLNYAH